MKKKELLIAKRAVQILLAGVVAAVTAFGFMAEKGVVLPSWVPTCLHGVCPFGGVATIGRVVAGGFFVPRTGAGNLFALAATPGASVFFGALFCGWLCPLGSVQEWVWKLGSRLGLNGKRGAASSLPDAVLSAGRKAAAVLPLLRYFTLVFIVFVTYRSFNLVFSNIDPYYALFHVWTGTALPAAVAVLGAVLAASLFVYRPWCRFLCPFGAVQGFAGKFAPFSIRRNIDLCTDCKACDRVCLSGVKPSAALKVSDTRCNRCLECVAACPVSGALVYSFEKTGKNENSAAACRGRLSVTKPAAAAALVLFTFFIPLTAGALWKAVSTAPAAAEAVYVRVNSADELTGAMSVSEAASAAGLEAGDFLAALDLPGDFDTSVKLRDIEEYYAEKTLRWIREALEPVFNL